MSRCLIISDLHLRHRQMERVIEWEKPDLIILLGDYFHGYGDTIEQNRDAVIWLKEKLYDSKFVCIIGNHDQNVRWTHNPNAYCSGSSPIKNKAINEILKPEDWNRLKPCFVYQDILFTHAGLHRYWIKEYFDSDNAPKNVTEINRWIEDLWPLIVKKFDYGESHSLLGVGIERGGFQPEGGITWGSFERHLPIKGIKQICGHTIMPANKGPLIRFVGGQGIPQACYVVRKSPRENWLKNGWTLCLDTNNRNYALIQDDKMIIKSVNWVRPKGDIDPHVEPGTVVGEFSIINQK